MRRRRARRCRRSSKTIESSPPLRPTSSRSPGLTARRSSRSTTETRPARLPPRLDLLEFAIPDQLVEAGCQQLFRRLIAQWFPGVLQRLAQVLQHGLRIAVCAAQWLVHDLVDES